MVDSMLTFPPIVEETSRRRPVVAIDRVKNKTMQHIDTESITDSIRARLLKSGKFRFIDRTTDSQAIDEVRYQQESGLTQAGGAVKFGRQLALWRADGEPAAVSPPPPAAPPLDPRIVEIGEFPDSVKAACRAVMRAAIDSGISKSDAIDQAVAHGRELLAVEDAIEAGAE
jgi:hypothetical protein